MLGRAAAVVAPLREGSGLAAPSPKTVTARFFPRLLESATATPATSALHSESGPRRHFGRPDALPGSARGRVLCPKKVPHEVKAAEVDARGAQGRERWFARSVAGSGIEIFSRTSLPLFERVSLRRSLALVSLSRRQFRGTLSRAERVSCSTREKETRAPPLSREKREKVKSKVKGKSVGAAVSLFLVRPPLNLLSQNFSPSLPGSRSLFRGAPGRNTTVLSRYRN